MKNTVINSHSQSPIDEILNYILKCKEEELFVDTKLFGYDSSDPILIHGLVLAALSPVFRSIARDPSGTKHA